MDFYDQILMKSIKFDEFHVLLTTNRPSKLLLVLINPIWSSMEYHKFGEIGVRFYPTLWSFASKFEA